MEGRKRSSKAGGGTTCMPRRRGHGRGASPGSLLDRLREVVFRLIMLTAASRGGGAPREGRRGEQGRAGGARVWRSDSYRSEAVEDCIEFFKRSASGVETKGGDNVGVAFRQCQPCEA